MSVIAAALKHMLAANMPHEAIIAAVEDMERGLQTDDQAERRRAADRERQRERRLRISADSADKADGPRGGVTRVEDKPLTTEIEPQKEEKKDAPARDLSDFKAEFSDLDAERLAALIKHRRSKHGQITGHAARLFRKAAADCGLPIAQAVDTCIDRNWITLKPDWLNKPQARGSPPAKPRGVGGVFSDLVEILENGQDDDNRGQQAAGSAVLSLPYRRAG